MDLNFAPQSPGQPLLSYAQSIICMQSGMHAAQRSSTSVHTMHAVYCIARWPLCVQSVSRGTVAVGLSALIFFFFFFFFFRVWGLLALEFYYPGLGNLLLGSGEKMT